MCVRVCMRVYACVCVCIQQKELEVQRKKNPSLDEVQAVAVSERLIQKLTNRMANQLRESADTDESVKALETLFNVTTDE